MPRTTDEKAAGGEAAALDTSAAAIRSWLAEQVADYLGRPAGAVATEANLMELGLDSVYALTLCGDVEDRYGIEVDTMLAWDHPSIDAMVAYLRGELG